MTSWVDAALLRDKYHALDGSTVINIKTLRSDVTNLMSNNMTIGGVKTFSKTP